MDYYSVQEVAGMLSVNEETVRRWIREGKIEAERGIGRQGSKITSAALMKFLEINKGLITTLAASILGLSPTSIGGGVIGEPTDVVMSSHPRKKTKIPKKSLSKILPPEAKNYHYFGSKVKDKAKIELEILQKQFDLENVALRLKNDILLKQNELKLVEEQLIKLQEILKKL